jgi:rare lipoprotein A
MFVAQALHSAAKTAKGIASFYGHNHHGKRMANGHRFDERKLTAASRTLPLGSRARITTVHGHKSVVVTITDRGPAKKTHRIIDLSTAAARVLGMLKQGTSRVVVKPVR